MKFGISVDLSGIRKLKKATDKQVRQSAARALNRAIDGVRAEAVREISYATKIKQSEIRKRMLVRGANVSRLHAQLQVLPYAPNLKKFRPTQNKRGVAASAWEKRKTYKGAFIHPHTGSVVSRVGTKRFPLKGLRGPSVPNTFVQKRIQARLDQIAGQRWRSEFERDLARRLSGSLGG